MQTKTHPLRRNRLASLLLEASPTAVFLINSRGIIGALNEVAQKWFGYEQAELVSQPFDVIFPTDLSSDNASQQARFLSQLSDPTIDQNWFLQGYRKDGTNFPTQVTLHPLTPVGGDTRLVHVIDISHDTLHQEHRIESERLAAVLQMASGLAHESRNALQRAQSCLDLLQLDLCDEDALLSLTDRIREALHDIHQNYEAVKSYAAPIVLKRTVVDLMNLCQSQFDDLTESLGENSHRLTMDCDIACKSVKVDASRIGDVLRHVLENAIHASPPKGIIEFDCLCKQTTRASAIEVRVRDHGEGLSDEVEKRMFEPFFTTKTKGTGLGLAICRRIVEAHDGTIQASNHPNGGTVVQIHLPAVTDTPHST